jgi:transposase
MGKIERIEVPAEDREELRRLMRDRNTPQKVVWRARIVLLAGNGMGALDVAAEVGTSVLTVRRWRRRYRDKGVAGLLKDATRPARKKSLSAQMINKVVNMTLHEKPPKATHWSLRSMAKASGVSPSSVQRIWKAHGLKPHLVRTFKLSRDPKFSEKGRRCRGPLSEPTRQSAGSVGRREEPDTSARSHSTRPANEKEPSRNHDT